MTNKIDFKKTVPSYQAKRGKFEVVEVPPMQYLMVDGEGDPNTSQEYVDAVSSLYPVAYKLKFMSKRELGRDYVVPPLEGLWWAEDMEAFTSQRDKSQWLWTMMIMVPEWINRGMFEQIVEQLSGAGAPPKLAEIRLESLEEGTCVQTLHVGPYDDEGPALEHMHAEFIPANGFALTGKHHEVYLSDPRRTAQEKLRTILRQPVTTAGV